jgi:lipopolysaccharide transport system ATP-binding protein
MNNSEIAIKVEKISKVYRIGLKEKMSDSFGGIILDLIKSPLMNYKKYRSLYSFDDIAPNKDNEAKNNHSDVIWALRDVSFDVSRGKVVGIIGRNGAGKSTLLKILSKITDPTLGRAEVRGRVSSLLEVGTGFHQELTGRENVYLNGTILGMKKVEIDKKFDEIVDFSGVERFIDTPVKRYSSGMRVRLAFSVAAHLEPEILIIDEVLAVGDSDFQKKCLNKMHDVSQQGRTVLFVSHNMSAVTRLCERAILLDEGRITLDGPSRQIVSEYLQQQRFAISAVREWKAPSQAPGGEIARLRAVRLKTEDGRITDTFDIREPIGIEMEYDVLKSGYLLLPHHHIHNEEGIELFTTHDCDRNWQCRRPAGRFISTAWIPGNFLTEGRHFIESDVDTMEPMINQFNERDVVSFQVVDTLEEGTSRCGFAGKMSGLVRPLLKWENHYISDP